MKQIISSVFLLSFLFFFSSCEAQTTKNKSNEWDSFVNRFIDKYFMFNPNYAVNAGRHEFDGQLPNFSKEGIENEINWLHNQRDSAENFDATSLNSNQKFLREYLLAVIDNNLFWQEDAKDPFKNPSTYSDAIDPSVYITRNYAPLNVRIKAYTKYASAVPLVIEQMKKNLQLPLPPTFSELGKNSFAGYTEYFKTDVPEVFSSVNDSKLQSEFKTANEKAIKAVEEAAEWYSNQEKNAVGNFMLGSDLFKEMLWKTERVDISLDSLLNIGENDLNKNLKELTEACNKYAPGKSIKGCILSVKKDKPPNGPVKEAREQLNELRKFIISKHIVSIPSKEIAQVEEAPPYERWNLAYINIPGPYEKNIPSIYYIAPPDPNWNKKEQEEYIPDKSFLLFVSTHEVWPGHFLQYLHAHEAPTKFQQIFTDYAFGEGWAHYSEQMMWDQGLGNGNPEDHIGQLCNALLRDVRFISAIKLHTGKMTVEESAKMFSEKAFQDPGNAKQQAARGTFDPAYLNYTLGKLMILKLRKDWMKLYGNNLQEFHDKFLSFGSPPIPLIRKAMLGKYDDGKLF